MQLSKPGSYFIIGIIIFYIICINSNASSEEIKSPLCPIVYSNGVGGFELFWFYPNKFKTSVGNNTIIPERGVYGSTNDRQTCFFTPINLTPPYYIESTNTFIRNEDMFPDLPGDQFTPIRLAIKEKVSNNYFDDLWYEYVSLEEDADYSGAIVEGETNIAINDLFNIYIALEWLPETPTSPLIGVNSSPPYFYQTVCPMDDSSFQMVYTNAGAMVGASILNWHSGFTEKDKNSSNDIINYEVLFSDDSAGVYTDGEVIASASSDSLTARFELSESGYVAVKATNGLDESFSDVNFIYKEKLPPVAIQPQLLIFSNQGQSSNNLLLENFGESNLELTIKYDTSLFILSDELINLETGSSVEINIGVREDVDFTSKVSSSIILKTTGEYYPQIIHVTLYGNEPTSVEGEEVLLPDDYMISQPYPNPFNSTIRFKLSQAHSDYIQMDIYNLIGQKVFSQITFSSQQESIKWDGTDYYGSKVGSGLYFIRFSSGNNTIIRKAVLLK